MIVRCGYVALCDVQGCGVELPMATTSHAVAVEEARAAGWWVTGPSHPVSSALAVQARAAGWWVPGPSHPVSSALAVQAVVVGAPVDLVCPVHVPHIKFVQVFDVDLPVGGGS